MKHPPARQLSQRERNNTTPTLTPSRISGLNPRPSTRKHTIMSRKAEGFSGNERCALNACLQVNLIVSAIEPLHRLLMFLRQFLTRIGEELLKAKHLSESAKASSLWIELHRHTVLHKVDLNTCNHQRLCSRIADPKPGARGPVGANKGPQGNSFSWST